MADVDLSSNNITSQSDVSGALTVPLVVQDVVLRFVELLKGTVSAQSTAEAVQLLASMQLAGDSAGASALSADLKELIQLKGTLAGASSASAVELDASRLLVAGATAQSAASAVELKATRSLAGSLASASSASAVQINASRLLVSDCQATSLAWALLSKEGIQEIKGALTAQSSASAVQMLASRLLVSNKCAGASGSSSDLTVTAPAPEELKGSASAVSGASAELVRSRVFSADTQADTSAIGALVKSLVVAGDSASQSGVTGGLSVDTGGWINIVFQGVEAISGQPVYLIGKYKAT